INSEELLNRLNVIQAIGYAPEEMLFLDIETCGFANCQIFLIGVMRACEGNLKIEQFFARNYAEEKSILCQAVETITDYKILVTFNGKSFDIPYILDRMIYHKLNARLEHEHLDILHHARRKWRQILPNCQLKTLEENICGRRRLGDTPGEIIPLLYHSFVRTGNAAPIEGIFSHNALDLITMAELLPQIELFAP
ncbi:MAG: ribonuclease H-like domain-containing protein, partial [Armatimonadota bacterium]|nr:ribonuclease H-like domain-containing protein [Armatimonadota bacterium]